MNARPDLQLCIDKLNKFFFATLTGDENKHTPIADKLFAALPPHQGNMLGHAEQMCASLDSVLHAFMISPDYDSAFKQSWWDNIRDAQYKIRECGRTYTMNTLVEALDTVKNEAKSISADHDAIAANNAVLKGKLDQLTLEHKQLVQQYEAFKAEANAQLNKITASYKPKMY